jgi:hypothetical protein
VKYRAGIDFVAHAAGGCGGYNPDHELFGYTHTIETPAVWLPWSC